MAVLPTKAQKTAYSIKMLKRQLKKLGPWGYLEFLVKKQRNNTADGTFGWLKKGNFFRENQKPSNQGFSNWLKNFIYLYGRHIADFRFVAQLWWLVLLVIIALGFGPRWQLIQLLRLAMIGGFIFLLLFEGGRSRYLIQYLPCLLLLGAFSFERAVANIQRVRDWYQRKLRAAIAADEAE
ncbi:integral membrane protein [Lactiplantibacillus plantarum]|nr:integral membrane protein [Lactiplantibacillus plantarum]